MIVKKHAKNIHEIHLDGDLVKVAMLSDIHWDNPKCDWKLLKHDLDYCLNNNYPIMFNGDTFCLMQGAFDFRKVTASSSASLAADSVSLSPMT